MLRYACTLCLVHTMLQLEFHLLCLNLFPMVGFNVGTASMNAVSLKTDAFNNDAYET